MRRNADLRQPVSRLSTPSTRVVGRLRAIADWLRAGYPTAAPRTGHSGLLALNGPLALTPAQKRRVTAELNGSPAEVATVEVAITKATDRLPTPAQTREIFHLLHRHSPRG